MKSLLDTDERMNFERFIERLVVLQTKGSFERLIERLHSFDIGESKTTAPSFKNLLDKLSIPAAYPGLASLSNFKTSSYEVDKKVVFWFSVL